MPEDHNKRTAEEWSRTFDSIMDLVFIIDKDSKLVMVNKKTCDFLKKKPEELVGKHCYEVMHGIDAPWPDCPHMKTLETREAASSEIDDPHIGTPLLVTVSPIFDEKGEFVQCVNSAKDITERKRAEEEVVRLASFPKLNPNPVVEIDFDGNLQYSNPATDLILPGLKESGLGHPFFVNWESVVKAFQIEKKDSFGREAKIGDRWFYQLFHLVPETNRVRIYAMNIDALKQAESELRETRDYLENLFNYASAPIIVWDSEFRITKFNRAFERLTGLSSHDAVNKHLNILFPKDKKEEAMSYIKRTLAGECWEAVEIPILHNDGTVRTLLWNSANLYDPSGKDVVATIAQGQDITERKKLEEKLKNAERMAAIGQTAAMVGHDLRNPLQAIVGFIGLAGEQLNGMGLSSAEKQEYESKLRAISDQIHYMNKIVSDLQDYAQPIKFALVRTDIEQLINETLYTASIPENVTVSINVSRKLSRVKIDPAIVRRVLTNLITNSLQAMPDGGKLNVKASRKRDPQTLIISVEDTGVGIPKADRPRIFVPLFTTKSKGQGFGLPVCKRLLDALGGAITFKSRMGKGSKFTITIPLNGRS